MRLNYLFQQNNSHNVSWTLNSNCKLYAGDLHFIEKHNLCNSPRIYSVLKWCFQHFQQHTLYPSRHYCQKFWLAVCENSNWNYCKIFSLSHLFFFRFVPCEKLFLSIMKFFSMWNELIESIWLLFVVEILEICE